MTRTTVATCLAAVLASAALLAQDAAAADPPLRSANDVSPIVGEYRLGAGDKLRIEVYKDTQLSQSVQIRPDGKITLPLIGDLEATNRTPIELRDQITKSLREFITNPVVTVIVQEALSAQVYITGEVSKSGPVQIVGPLNILQAIAMAGGLNEFANKKDVRILRQGAAGLETIRFNYQDALNGDIRPIYLKAGDTIVVK
jgi:polysaccharide export outer membrane protein